MASTDGNGKNDGIEIHCDEGGGTLTLDCEPDAFARFRQFVAGELPDFLHLPLDKVETIEIIDAYKQLARRESPRRYAFTFCLVVAFFVIAIPWGAGVGLIVRWISN